MIDPREGEYKTNEEVKEHAIFMMEITHIVDEYEERMENYSEWT